MVSNTIQKLKYYASYKEQIETEKKSYYFTIAFNAITCWLFIDDYYYYRFTSHISLFIYERENAKCKHLNK